MSEKPFVSVVVPVLNEEGNVSLLHERLTKILDEEANGHEIIFVDDGSTDGTASAVENVPNEPESARNASPSGRRVLITIAPPIEAAVSEAGAAPR